MFQSGFSVPRGSGALRASVFRAICFLVLVIDVVLSQNVIISLSGIILIGEIFLRLMAIFLMLCSVDWSEESPSSIVDWNCMSSWGSESDSSFQIVSAFSIGCFSPLRLSKWNFVISFYDRFFGDVLDVMFDIGVLSFLPKCAVNGAIFVVVLGMSFFSWIISVILSASVIFDQLGSLFRTERRRFIICIRRSIIPLALWSPAGASIS